jgi:hypothetical protein
MSLRQAWAGVHDRIAPTGAIKGIARRWPFCLDPGLSGRLGWRLKHAARRQEAVAKRPCLTRQPGRQRCNDRSKPSFAESAFFLIAALASSE